MKQIFRSIILLLFSSIFVFGQDNEQTDQIILKLKTEVSNSPCKLFSSQKNIGNDKIDAVSQKFHVLKISKHSAGKKTKQFIYVAKFPEGTNIKQVIEEYYKTGEIEYAEPDMKDSGGGTQGVAPNDDFFARQWGLNNDGTFPYSPSVAGADVDMEDAWTIEQGDSNLIVTIIDSGTKLDHPEFENRIWINHGEIPNDSVDNDSNGYIDDVNGWDFAYVDNDPSDDYGHGTNVSGILGATGNNSIGYAGINWNSKLMILKALNINNQGYHSWFIDAIYYAVDNGARVISMSIGGTSISFAYQNAINYALDNKVVFVACMMNTNSDVVYYPAAYPGVIAVGSTNSDDTRTHPFFWDPGSGSNFGNHISVVAPGNYIFGLDYSSNFNYNSYWGGTSQATPLVSGIVSLLLSQDSTRTPAEIKFIIESTAEDLVGDTSEDKPGWDQYYGFGRVNAFNALSFTNGISNINNQNQNVVLFPNPAKDNFTAIVPPSTKQIQIFNSLGQSIQVKKLFGQSKQNFQLRDNGIYFIQVTTDSRTITKKLIVNN